VYSVRYGNTGFKERHKVESVTNPCGGGSNISTVTLLVVGGDEMESLKSETVKYGRESQGPRARE
jgi:hypothetical protein